MSRRLSSRSGSAVWRSKSGRAMLAPMLARAVAVLVVGFIVGSVSLAHADGPYEGQWRQGPASITVAVDDWGPDCGPRPQSSTLPSRGAVSVTQDGDHLSFGGRRTTRGCWSDNTAVRLVSSRVQAGVWQILCRTPTDDPRRETGTYTLRAVGADRIDLRDETSYDWSLNQSRCVARVTTTQSFERVRDPSTAPPREATPVATDRSAPPEPACTPGAPARVQVRPARIEASVEERPCLTARVLDAQGCWVRSESVTLSVAPTDLAVVRGNCLELQRAGEGVVTARGGGLEARASVRVVDGNLSDLIARRSEAGLLGSDDEAEVGRDAGVAASAAPRDEGSALWIRVLAVVLVIVAGALALLLLLRERRRRAERAARAERALSEAAAMPAPDAAPAPASTRSASSTSSTSSTSSEALICPICRRGYPAGTIQCEKDREPLVPYAEFVARRAAIGADRVCPTCGARYPSTTQFCGKDGTTLR